VYVLGSTSNTVIVECGELRRPITYTSGGDESVNLKNAIVQSFGGLTQLQLSQIAMLQVKSSTSDKYMDLLSPTPIPSNSSVKVVTLNGVSATKILVFIYIHSYIYIIYFSSIDVEQEYKIIISEETT